MLYYRYYCMCLVNNRVRYAVADGMPVSLRHWSVHVRRWWIHVYIRYLHTYIYINIHTYMHKIEVSYVCCTMV